MEKWKYTLIIITLTVIIGGGILYYKHQILDIKNKTVDQARKTQDKTESILINKIDGMYELDLLKNELTPHKNIYFDIQKFDGFPLIVKNESNGAMFNDVIFSQDKNEVLMYGETNGEFHCILSTKKCFESNIISNVRKILKEKNKGCGGLYGWDPKNGLMFIQEVGDCQNQFNFPIFIIDTNNKAYDVIDKSILLVDTTMLSPSFSSFFTVEENRTENNNINTIDYQISIFDIDSLLSPKKSFEFPIKTIYTYIPSSPGYVTKKYLSGPVSFRDVIWSPDEKFIAISSQNEIYLLNIYTGQFDLIYQGKNFVYDVVFSSGGRFIVFTDDFENLKGIDLQKDNLIIEIRQSSLIERDKYPGYYPDIHMD